MSVDPRFSSTSETPSTIRQHWHGLLQHTTNWADGASFINQCPITSGNCFEYEFDTTGISGTSTHPYPRSASGLNSTVTIRHVLVP